MQAHFLRLVSATWLVVYHETYSFKIPGSVQGDINGLQVTAPTARRVVSSMKTPAVRFDDDAVCAIHFDGLAAPGQVGNSAEQKWKTAGGCNSLTEARSLNCCSPRPVQGLRLRRLACASLRQSRRRWNSDVLWLSCGLLAKP